MQDRRDKREEEMMKDKLRDKNKKLEQLESNRNLQMLRLKNWRLKDKQVRAQSPDLRARSH